MHTAGTMGKKQESLDLGPHTGSEHWIGK